MAVDTKTHTYNDIDIKQTNGRPYITAASFSPDGKVIVYAQSDCSQCGSEIWRISLDNDEKKLLFQNSKTVISNILWSPDGNYIAFTQYSGKEWEWDKFIIGELHLMKPDGSEQRLLSPITTHFFNQPFRPVWSSDGQQITFVKNVDSLPSRELNQLASNIYLIDLPNNQVNQLTEFENIQAVRPVWSPEDSKIISLGANLTNSSTQFNTWITEINTNNSYTLNINQTLKGEHSKLSRLSSIVWLP